MGLLVPIAGLTRTDWRTSGPGSPSPLRAYLHGNIIPPDYFPMLRRGFGCSLQLVRVHTPFWGLQTGLIIALDPDLLALNLINDPRMVRGVRA